MPLTKSKEDAMVAVSLIGIGSIISYVIATKYRKKKYSPDKVWKFEEQGGTWGKLNRPTAGPQNDKQLPRGEHALQLYSFGTPNGVKVTSLLEELNLRYGIEYDAYSININKGDQFGEGFTKVNPNSKIPALLHYEKKGEEPTAVFETAAIMVYLCEKFDKDHVFLPKEGDPLRADCLSWVFFVHGGVPFVGGGFGHFYNYAPEKIKYAIDRYSMETKRQLSVLDRHLGGVDGTASGGGPYLCGENCTIADLAAWPWYGNLVLGKLYGDAATFLNVKEYPHVKKWADRMFAREGVLRGRMVNRFWGAEEEQVHERHSAEDFVEKRKKQSF